MIFYSLLFGLILGLVEFKRGATEDYQTSWGSTKAIYTPPVLKATEGCGKVKFNSLDVGGGKSNVMEKFLKNWHKFYRRLLKFDLKKANMNRNQKYDVNKKRGKRKKTLIDHLRTSYKPGDPGFRIQKELKSFIEQPPRNCKVTIGQNIKVWVITITGADGTIYAGEKYKLKVIFPKDYPRKPPSVYFLKPCPKHVHVYSNGDICLDLLGRGWRPQLTIESIAVSILSILSNAKDKKLPPDNAMHSDNPPGLQQEGWMYHDDRC